MYTEIIFRKKGKAAVTKKTVAINFIVLFTNFINALVQVLHYSIVC